MSIANACCTQMQYALDEPEIPLVCTPKFREIGVQVLDGGTSQIELFYCPWCGQKLPKSLRSEWFDELERLGIDPNGDNIPAEFSDEHWYKQEGPA